MKKYFFLLLSIMMIILCGCFNNNHNKIKIGVILPLTGETASFAHPMKNGIEYAMSELDSSKYELIFVDSQNNSNTAISNLRRLISIEKIKYVIGDFGSSTTLAILPIAEQNGIFLFSPGAQTPKLTNISPYFARCYPSSNDESKIVANYIYDKLASNNIAVIYANDEYGTGLATRFKDEFLKKGGTINMFESYPSQQQDFRNLLQKVKEMNISVIYLAGNQKEMGRFMRQFSEYKLQSQIVSDIAFLENECLNIAGEAANGAIVPVTYYNPNDSLYKGAYKFALKYKQKKGILPTISEAVGYDALKLMVLAIENSDSPLHAAEYIRNLKNYDGASGLLNFTNGDVTFPYIFKQIVNGEIQDICGD